MLLNKRLSIFYFINLIKFDFILIVAYTVVTALVRHYAYLHDIVIPIGIALLLGTLISLLLAFKTSQSYERWWEARIVWGSIVNDSRIFIRQLKQFMPKNNPGAQQNLSNFAERQIIWVYVLGESLRKTQYSDGVSKYIDRHSIQSNNIPNQLLELHAEQLHQISIAYNIDSIKQVQLDSTLARLTDAMGKCERIKNTVFPRSYSVLIHFIIYVFITIFPFGLSELGDLMEVLLSVAIPLLFISIERTALVMQDPFENRPTDTPMTALAKTIENNLREAAGMDLMLPDNSNEGSYYIM